MDPVDLRVRTGDTRPSNPLNKKQCAEDDGREEVGLARAITPHDDVMIKPSLKSSSCVTWSLYDLKPEIFRLLMCILVFSFAVRRLKLR